MELGGILAVSILATGLVIATALGRSAAQSQALAVLHRPRISHVVLPRRPAAPAPAATSDPSPASDAAAASPTDTPAADASIAARSPAPPAPITMTSCSCVW